jgi:hypothetical protein
MSPRAENGCRILVRSLCGCGEVEGGIGQRMCTYLSLQVAHKQTLQNLARLIGMAHVLECFCGVLAAYVEEHFLTAAVEFLSANCPSHRYYYTTIGSPSILCV